MNVRRLRSACACAALALSSLALAQPTGRDARGEAVVAALRTWDAAALEALFDDAMRVALPHARLVSTLAQIRAQTGELRACGAPVGRDDPAVAVVDYRCEFDNGAVTVRVAWDADGLVTGLFVLPVAPEPAAAAAPPSGVREEAITTGAPGWPLPGTVLVPAPAVGHRPPIAVLVHGSGPNDRDETIGAVRPFLDLAIGLAARGIATLRYDKRTNALGPRFVDEIKAPTLDDEIVDDAVAALVLAASRRDVDGVFVVGHSQGAWLAPRIASAAAARGVRVRGIVMLAAPLTPFADLIVDQYAFLAAQDPPGATREMVDEMARRRDNVARLVRGDGAADAPLPLGLPPSLWRDLARYDPAAALRAQPRLPALLTFGARDFQVPIREKGLWAARLAGRADATIVAFPRMNHLLVDGDGPMSTAEYARGGHVSQALIDRVADWIDAHAGVPRSARRR